MRPTCKEVKTKLPSVNEANVVFFDIDDIRRDKHKPLMSLLDGMFAQRFNAVSGKVDWVHVPEGKQVCMMLSCTYMSH